MRFASPSPRRAAGQFNLKAFPRRPESGTLGDFLQILRGMPLDEVMSGVAFMAIMAVAFLVMVVFS